MKEGLNSGREKNLSHWIHKGSIAALDFKFLKHNEGKLSIKKGAVSLFQGILLDGGYTTCLEKRSDGSLHLLLARFPAICKSHHDCKHECPKAAGVGKQK